MLLCILYEKMIKTLENSKYLRLYKNQNCNKKLQKIVKNNSEKQFR